MKRAAHRPAVVLEPKWDGSRALDRLTALFGELLIDLERTTRCGTVLVGMVRERKRRRGV